jgi:hypothetical protein
MKFSEWIEIKEGKKAKHDACYHKVKAMYDYEDGEWSAYASGNLVRCRKMGAKNFGRSKKETVENELPNFEDFMESKFKLEKDRGLKGWFDRNNGKGWIDCKASKKGNLVPCGREKAGKGSDRSYPACRPTLSMCNKSKHKKKSSKPISWEKD